MKKHSFPYFLIFALAFPFISSCVDSSDKPIGPATDNSKADLLTASPWKLSAYTVNPGLDVNNDGTPETDLFPIVAPDSCTIDDLTIFKADKSYIREEGATKCDSTAEQVFESGTWALTNNSSKLVLTEAITPGSEVFDIVELTAPNLIISFKDTINGVVHTFTQTLKH